jgi:hypothetical protein
VPVPDTVTFGIPLMARSVAQDWERIEHQLSATVGSIYNQTDGNFRIIIACTDRPTLSVATDARLEYLMVDQLPLVDSSVFITDGVRKRFRIAMRLRELGGGYLMLPDGDDLVSRHLVDYVRKTAHPNGYIVAKGYMLDAARGWLAPFPFAESERFYLESHTCSVFRLTPEELPTHDADFDCRFGYLMARGHPAFKSRAEAEGRPLLEFPFRAAVYVRNTGENVSTRNAATTVDGDARLQVYLDDELEAQRMERTPELDDEFNLKAADAPQFAMRSPRQFRPLVGLSVLVATHRRPEGLRRLLTALRPQVEGRAERSIVIVNDGSHDEAYAAVVSEFADVITYLPLDGHSDGVGSVRNAAVDLCRGTYAVFTDDDCVPPPWWLDWVAARLLAQPEVDVVVGYTKPPDRPRSLREKFHGTFFMPQPSRLGRWRVFVTACVAIRANLINEVGGFLPTVSVGEDTELCIRLQRARARFSVDRNWWVTHDVDRSLLALFRRYYQYGAAQAWIGAAAHVETPDGLGGNPLRHLQSLRKVFSDYRESALTFSENPLVRGWAAAWGTLIHYAYLRGLASVTEVKSKR